MATNNTVTVSINPSDYKILVVDDVMPNVLLLKVMLTNEKFNIVTASNGEQAIEQVRNEKPDLILLDVMMPGMTGYEVAQVLQNDPETKEIPIIFLTALNTSEDIVRGFRMGGSDFQAHHPPATRRVATHHCRTRQALLGNRPRPAFTHEHGEDGAEHAHRIHFARSHR